MLQTKSQTQYTIKELQSYVKNPNSSVHRITDKLHIGLAPAGLANFKDAVVSSVTRAKVGRFDQKLNGIVLDIRNFKVLGNVFAIHDDDPQLHVDLYADLYVFQPTVGAVIKGVVKHIARGHISVTVHRVFNVAIRLDGDKEGLEVNMEIVIRITDFDLTLKLPFIAGVLDQPLSVATKKIVFDANSDESDSDEVDRKALVSQFLADNNIKIKKEPLSDTNSESSNSSDTDGTKSARDDRRTKRRLKREPSVDSSSSDSSSDQPHSVVRIKREKATSSSSSGSSSDSSDTDHAKSLSAKRAVKLETKSIKHESSASSSDSDTSRAASPVRPVVAEKTKRTSAALKVEPDQTPKKNNKIADDSLANLSAFATPGLSSTLKPDATKKGSTKHAAKPKDRVQELMEKMLARK